MEDEVIDAQKLRDVSVSEAKVHMNDKPVKTSKLEVLQYRQGKLYQSITILNFENL